MKTIVFPLYAAVALVAMSPAASAADSKASAAGEKRELRVLSAPDRERRVFVHRDGEKAEKEVVAFLGVETSPVTAALSAQLSLPRGTGLTVNHVVAKSPAAAVLKEHDILLKLDDQILIETRQLSVLIRGHKEGDEVTLTYLRAGQKTSAKIKLGKQEVPKFSWAPAVSVRAFAGFGGRQEAPFEFHSPEPESEREHTDRVLALIGRARGAPDAPPGSIPPPLRIQMEHGNGAGVRAMSVNTGNSSIVYSDDEGALELTIADGAKTLVAKNGKGEQVFSGPVTTPEEREAVPAGVRVRLEKLEDMRDVSFRTDGDFKGTLNRVVRPRGVEFMLPAVPVRIPAPPIFF